MKELERENAKLKRLVAKLSLEKQIVKDVASGKFRHAFAERRV
jgi:putative transposase